MKKIFKYALMLVMAITGVMAVSSCSSDDDEEENSELVELRAKLDGTWTLVKYKGENINWGEYMEIIGDSMVWNSRLEGLDSKYKLTFKSDSTFSAKCVWSNGKDEANDWEFKISKCTRDSLETIDVYDRTRLFLRKK